MSLTTGKGHFSRIIVTAHSSNIEPAGFSFLPTSDFRARAAA